jgi:hypothetical protein
MMCITPIVGKCPENLTNPGDQVEKVRIYDPFSWKTIDSALFFMQSFSVEIRPNTQFVHTFVDRWRSRLNSLQCLMCWSSQFVF